MVLSFVFAFVLSSSFGWSNHFSSLLKSSQMTNPYFSNKDPILLRWPILIWGSHPIPMSLGKCFPNSSQGIKSMHCTVNLKSLKSGSCIWWVSAMVRPRQCHRLTVVLCFFLTKPNLTVRWWHCPVRPQAFYLYTHPSVCLVAIYLFQ